jgi:hypothetical protein
MDPRLAEIYGTNENAESDVEKTAAAELAEKLASENETDIDGMSDDEIEALAQEVLSADEQTEETTDETDEGEEKTASTEKVAEADFLGRVMAHAYVNELKSIDKEASVEKTARGGKVLKALKGMSKKAADEKNDKEEKKDDKKMPPFMKKEKKSSALDTLAGQRAMEILKENGIELEEEKQTEEKQASKADVLAQAVEARAVELLKAEGFKFEE